MSYQALQQVQKEVREGRVNERPHEHLCIYKYSQDCVHDNLWNDINIRCRGIVFDTSTGSVVCRSFNKFFNLGERPTTQAEIILKKAKHTSFRVTEKYDGSMLCLWYYNNEWCCSTPGSITSEQAIYAKNVLIRKYNLSILPTNLTYVCELITPMDRNDKVVEYGDKEDLFLITAFENKWEQIEVPFGRVQYFSQVSQIPIVPVWQADYDTFLNLNIPSNVEGYVVSFEDSFRIKVKSFEYLRAFRLVADFSRKHIFEYIQSGEYREAVKHLPEVKRIHFDDVYAKIMQVKGETELEIQQWADKCDANDMKKSAEIIKDIGPIKSLVFNKLRNKPVDSMLWKLVAERFYKGATL